MTALSLIAVLLAAIVIGILAAALRERTETRKAEKARRAAARRI